MELITRWSCRSNDGEVNFTVGWSKSNWFTKVIQLKYNIPALFRNMHMIPMGILWNMDIYRLLYSKKMKTA